MKAIVTLPVSSVYAKYNHLTFDVVDICSKRITLDIYGSHVDFYFSEVEHTSEVIVVDLHNELQKAYNDKNWGSDNLRYGYLVAYLRTLNMPLPKLEYSCPA